MRFGSVLLVVLFSGALWGQTTDATLSGTVSDATGAVIPAAAVSAQNTRTGVMHETKTNGSGVYLFASLPPGTYRVSAVSAGFRKTVFHEVVLEVSARLTLDAKLELSASADVIEVNADAESALGYATSSVGGMVTGRKVLELPLTTRNALGLALTQAGIVGDNFAGARIGTLNIQIDGINVQDARINNGVSSTIFPSTDRVEEFRVVVSPVDAEMGRGSGQVQMITRSGTNEFHGSLFNFHRNTALNANTWFNNQRGLGPDGAPISPRNFLIRNQFGGRIGGPVWKNKTFFHFLYEGQRIRTKNAVTTTVLTQTARQGLYRFFPGVQNGNANSNSPVVDVQGNAVRPARATGELQTASVFGRDANRMTADATSVVARHLAMLPLPNNFQTGDGLNTAGYTWSRRGTDDRNQINIKIDHFLSGSHRMAFSLSRDTEAAYNGFMPQNTPGSPGGNNAQNDMVTSLTLTSTLRPNVVSDFFVGALRPRILFNAPWQVAEAGLLATAGSQPYALDMLTVTDPINIANDPQGRISPNYQIGEKISWLKGKHNVKFGGRAYFVSTNGFNAFDVLPRVIVGAGGAPVTGINQIAGIGLNQAGAQNLLLDLSGSVGSIRQAFNSPGGANPQFVAGEGKQRTWREREYSFFFQDDFKIHPDLTLTLGTRYEYLGVPWDANGRTVGLVGGSAGIFGITGTTFADLYQPGRLAGSMTRLEQVGPNSPNRGRGIYGKDFNNWSPVVGVAWNLPFFGKGKTTFRAGYSMGFERHALRLIDVVAGDQPGLRSVANFQSARALNLGNIGLPLTPVGAVLEEVPLTDRTQTVRTYDSGLRTPYVQNWNASIDRQLPGRTLLSVRYVGTKGTKLIRGFSVNEHMIFENGLLDAFLVTQAGGNAPLFDRMLNGLNVAGLGVVDGVRVTGSQVFRQANTTTQGHLAGNNVGAMAAYLDNTTYLTNVRGGLLRRAGLPENFFIGNPQFASARLFGNLANSTYHSMHLEMVKRFSSGWTLQSNYTWSKALGEEEGAEQEIVDSYRDNRNRRLDKRLMDFHIGHVWRNNGLFELPFGPKKRFVNGSNPVLGRIVGGWQVGAIFNV
ncbi:MAG: TonB-dependent receptor, partial [Bryobacterales bacterium]|nr:TonB-dependent receptor [Bryobacterales bacterium]